jgi:hypothetical protein
LPDRSCVARRIRNGVVLAAFMLLAWAVPGGAATTVTPESATNCGGSLRRAPTSDEPNTLSYKFNCDGGITAYTIIASRGPSDLSTIDDFSPNSLAYGTSGVDSKVSFTCEGSIPGNGVNCNTGGSSYLQSPEFVEGTFDTTDPYCGTVPTKATTKATTKASSKAEPQAVVQLIVSDVTGAEDGPFRLNLKPACKAQHATKKSVKHRRKHKSTRVAAKRR